MARWILKLLPVFCITKYFLSLFASQGQNQNFGCFTCCLSLYLLDLWLISSLLCVSFLLPVRASCITRPRSQGKEAPRHSNKLTAMPCLTTSVLSASTYSRNFQLIILHHGHTLCRKRHGPFHTLFASRKNDLLWQIVNDEVTHFLSWTNLWCLIQGANAMTFWPIVTVSGYLYLPSLKVT